MKAELADGRVLEFPDGTSPEVVQATVKKVLAQGQPQAATPETRPKPNAVMAALSGVTKGLGDYTEGAFQLGAHGLNKLGVLGDEKTAWVDAALKKDEEMFQERTQGSNWATGGRIGANVAATLPMAPAKAASGLKAVWQGAKAGGLISGAQPVTEGDFWKEKAKQTGVGFATGGVAAPLLHGAARVISPKTAPEVKQLMGEGVTPTPGQIMGGAAQRIEEGATSIPILGDVIKGSQRRAAQELNEAAITRSLAPIGKQLPKDAKSGHDAVAFAENALGKAYDDLLPKLTARADNVFMAELRNVSQMAGNLPEAQMQQFGRIVQSEVLDKFTPQGLMSGETMKAVESKLGSLASQYKGSADPDQRILGDAIRETQATLRAMVTRNNPQHAGKLQKINEGWANFVRVQTAAARQGAKEGVFTPAQLKSAVRQTDKSLRKSKFARGDALMQDLAESGEKVLGQKVPDSGTPFRLTNMGAAGFGYMVEPSIPIGMGILSSLYTAPAQKVIAGILTKRPDMAEPLANYLRLVAPTTGGVLGHQGYGLLSQ